MIDFILNIIVYLIVQAALLAVAVGVAFILHGCVPGLDIGMALLVSTLSSIACAHLMVKALKMREIEIFEDFLRRQAEGDSNKDDDELSSRTRLPFAPSTKKRRRASKEH